MNIYIWQNTYGITTHYHDGGTILIRAETKERAFYLYHEHQKAIYQEKERSLIDDPLDLNRDEPDFIYILDVHDTVTEGILIFPDAGCC